MTALGLRERQAALLGIALGVGLLVAALLLWRTADVASVGRGAAYALVVAGLAYAALSGGYIPVAAGRAADAAELYAKLTAMCARSNYTWWAPAGQADRGSLDD